MDQLEWEGIPRQEIPWYPTVDYDKCDGCKTCFEFCPHNTYDWNEEDQRPVAARPYNCIVQCSNCAGLCPSQAIAFPPLSMLKELKDNWHREADN